MIPDLQEKDALIIKKDDTTYNCTVNPTFIHIQGTQNYALLDLCGFEDAEARYKYSSEKYGYKTWTGDWPEYHKNDYDAARKLIWAIHTDFDTTITLKRDGKIIYSTDPKHRRITEDTEVIVTVDGTGYKLKVQSCYMEFIDNHCATAINGFFEKLGTTQTAWLTKVYGYKPGTGCWKEWEYEDVNAATRVLNALKEEKAVTKLVVDGDTWKDGHKTASLVKQGDIIDVVIDSVSWSMKVCDNYMSMQDHGGHTSDTVIRFFKALGHEDISTWLSKVYGYEDKGGCWPSWRYNDEQAPVNIINALKEEKKVSCIKINDKLWYKDTIGDLEELRKLKAKLDKDKYHVVKDDIVIFKVHGKTFNYRVANNHLRNNYGNNDVIFKELDLNPQEFCTEAYGYGSGSGVCPTCKPDDYDALSRLVSMLATYCDDIVIKRVDDHACVSPVEEKIESWMPVATPYVKTTMDNIAFDMQVDDYFEGPVNPDPAVGLTIKKFNVKF